MYLENIPPLRHETVVIRYDAQNRRLVLLRKSEGRGDGGVVKRAVSDYSAHHILVLVAAFFVVHCNLHP